MVFGVGGADTEERAPNKNDAPLTLRVKTGYYYLFFLH